VASVRAARLAQYAFAASLSLTREAALGGIPLRAVYPAIWAALRGLPRLAADIRARIASLRGFPLREAAIRARVSGLRCFPVKAWIAASGRLPL
jgi:hypothetical protein